MKGNIKAESRGEAGKQLRKRLGWVEWLPLVADYEKGVEMLAVKREKPGKKMGRSSLFSQDYPMQACEVGEDNFV